MKDINLKEKIDDRPFEKLEKIHSPLFPTLQNSITNQMYSDTAESIWKPIYNCISVSIRASVTSKVENYDFSKKR